MGLLQDFIQKWKERKAKAREIEDDVRIREKIVAKRKSANERELEGYLEEERQRQIKEQLEAFRERKKQEMWHSPTAIDTPNMFKQKSPNLLHQPSLLRGRSLFLQ